MDVDSDIDSQLLQKFSSITTTDRDVLIAEFQRLLGNQLSEAGCIFFLDMNNWNLEAAICSYFEYDQPNTKIPQMSFVQDITIGEGESIPPNTKFMKTWRVQNSGDELWPHGCHLRFIGGNKFGENDSVMVERLEPGACSNISIDMISPIEVGLHQSQWRMCTSNGLFFGDCIWVILQVDEGGLLGVTQLLSQFGCSEFDNSVSRQHTSNPQHNPFSSTSSTPFNQSSTASDDRQSNFQYDENIESSSVALAMTTTMNPRHSSLPSSPRWFGDLGSSPVHFSAESLRPRPILFQTPDNSPSKTISSTSSKMTTNPTLSDMDSMEMS